MNYWFFTVAGIAAVALAVTRFVVRGQQQRAIAREREAMSTEEIYRAWYQSRDVRKDTFAELWTEVAECLRQSPGLLRPQDRFGEDVGRAWITTDELDELRAKAVRRAEALGVKLDLSKIRTVDDYILTLSNKVGAG